MIKHLTFLSQQLYLNLLSVLFKKQLALEKNKKRHLNLKGAFISPKHPMDVLYLYNSYTAHLLQRLRDRPLHAIFIPEPLKFNFSYLPDQLSKQLHNPCSN